MIALGSAIAFPFLVALLAYVGHLAETWIEARFPVGRAAHRKGGE